MEFINKIGVLDPEGKLHECESYEHLDLAWEIVVDEMGNPGKVKNRLEAEEYLQRNGWIIVRARDVYGMIGYLKYPEDITKEERIHMTDEQKKWLNDNYKDMIPDKQKTVDELFKWDA